ALEEAGEVELAEHGRAGHVVNCDLLAEVVPHGGDRSLHGLLDDLIHRAPFRCGDTATRAHWPSRAKCTPAQATLKKLHNFVSRDQRFWPARTLATRTLTAGGRGCGEAISRGDITDDEKGC